MTPKDTFVAELARIDRIIDSICRRHLLVGDDADDFRSWVHLKLIDNDYEVFRRFRGKSSLGTYLTVVIANLFKDHRISGWGRWRPSAAARRQGPFAIRLETMLSRDGYTFREAIEVLESENEIELSNRELRELAASFPERGRPRPVGDEPLSRLSATDRADEQLWLDERTQENAATRAALERVLASLPDEDQIIIRLRFWSGFTIADVARTLGLEQRPLYRRVERILARMRTALEEEEIDHRRVLAFLFHVPV